MDSDDCSASGMTNAMTFQELVDSRRTWISTILMPWCISASRRELVIAATEWTDLAGKAAPEKTLWYWAWSRFPQLCNNDLCEIDETWPVLVVRRDGTSATGFPDARSSQLGELVLRSAAGEMLGPFSIDDIERIVRLNVDDCLFA